jgi:hypothetical protein
MAIFGQVSSHHTSKSAEYQGVVNMPDPSFWATSPLQTYRKSLHTQELREESCRLPFTAATLSLGLIGTAMTRQHDSVQHATST